VEDSFDGVVVDRGPALLRFAYLLIGDRHRAEDLVQEVLAKVHQRWNRIERAGRG
jgi:DNA-directed RNA polymerase specialized sigma24 family protein